MSWDDPSWKEAAAEYHKARGDRVSLVNYDAADLARLRSIIGDRIVAQDGRRCQRCRAAARL